MTNARNIIRAPRALVVWLLMAFVFLSPVGVGVSATLSPTNDCGVSCPCDAPAPDVADQLAADVDSGSSEHSGDPCQDDCPDNCPDCDCCLGAPVAAMSNATPSIPEASPQPLSATPIRNLVNRPCTGLFRPPQAHA